MKTGSWAALAVGALVFSGCSNDSKDEGGATSGSTDACTQWQDELVAKVEDCSSLDTAEFEADLRAVHCASDAAATQCVSQLQAGGCDQATFEGCDISDLADKAAAQTQCQRFIDTYCGVVTPCGEYESLEACQADGATSLDCTTAVGWSSTLETCLTDLQALACDQLVPPASCQEVIKLH